MSTLIPSTNSDTVIAYHFCRTGRDPRFIELQIKTSEEAPAQIRQTLSTSQALKMMNHNWL